jgi:uncharacterized protein YbjT (DUF2867 family)
MILVTSAAGKTGRHIIAALKARGLPVRALVRREHADLLADETVMGDMLSPADLRRACEGVQAVVHTGPIHLEEPTMGRWAIDAARAAGAPHFIYISVTHPQTSWLLNHQNKLKVEDYLIDSGLPFTILQPMHYMQNIDVKAAVARGVYASAYGKEKGLSFVDLLDLAEAAAKVAAEPGHLYATYEICGSDHATTDEVAALIAERSGKPIANERIAIPDLLARIPHQQGYVGDFLIRLFTYYERYGIRANPNVLTWLLGRPPTTLAQYVDRMLAS